MRTLALILLCISCWEGHQQVDAAGTLRKVSDGGVLYASAPLERGAYAVGGSKGQSHYGYNTGTGIAKVEVRQANGAVVGSYRYFDPNGKQVVRSYIADSNGFRVLGNDLPISPDTPVSKVLGAPALTGAYEGTTGDIPPPLLSSSTVYEQVVRQPTQVSQQLNSLVQQQEREYQQQHRQLEQQREALRVQQEKLEALQRQLEAQERTLQRQLPAPTEILPQRRVTAERLTASPWDPYYRTANTLTGGVTSPYIYYDEDWNYDFPAGFAYHGLPVTRAVPQPQPRPVRRGCYPGSTEPGCGSNYIIGRAR